MITANKLVKELAAKELTIAFAESITCGMGAHALASYKGTGDVLRCSLVVYNEEIKTKVLKVPASLIKKYTAESAQVTHQMALQLRRMKLADINAAITGLASEGGSETKDKPVGTVFYAVSYKGRIHVLRKRFRGTPLQIRQKACENLFDFILTIIH